MKMIEKYFVPNDCALPCWRLISCAQPLINTTSMDERFGITHHIKEAELKVLCAKLENYLYK